MPDFSGLIDKHFKVSNISKALKLTLKGVEPQEVGQDKETLAVALFIEDPRGLVLNAGRYLAFAEANKSRNTDDWTGTVIELYVDPDVTYKGKKTGGLKVKVIQPAAKS
jgi:hypothetical protein